MKKETPAQVSWFAFKQLISFEIYRRSTLNFYQEVAILSRQNAQGVRSAWTSAPASLKNFMLGLTLRNAAILEKLLVFGLFDNFPNPSTVFNWQAQSSSKNKVTGIPALTLRSRRESQARVPAEHQWPGHCNSLNNYFAREKQTNQQTKRAISG